MSTAVAAGTPADAAPSASRSPPRAWRRRLPLLPALIFTVLVTQVPFVMSIFYSLTNWTVVPPTPREFVGLENYSELVDDQFFRDAA